MPTKQANQALQQQAKIYEQEKRGQLKMFSIQTNASLETKTTPILDSSSFSISKDDFELYEKATDTFLCHGREIDTLRYKHRDKFLQDHPLVTKLLARESYNPLLREGPIDDKEGEHYLTSELLALLLHLQIIVPEHTPKPTHLLFIENDYEAESNFISSLALKDGEDALLVTIIHKIHTTFQYIYQDKGVTKSIYIDVEPNGGYIPEVQRQLQEHFPRTKIYFNGIRLQKDYFSCGTFAIKLGPYCVTQRNELFNQIDKNEKTRPEQKTPHSATRLTLDNLPAEFRKMGQAGSYQNATDDKTFSQAVEGNTIRHKDKNLNVAAAIDKYQNLHQLETWLRKTLTASEQAEITAQGHIPLPAKLEQIIQKLSYVPKQKPVRAYDKYDDPIEDLFKHLELKETSPNETWSILPDINIKGDELKPQQSHLTFKKRTNSTTTSPFSNSYVIVDDKDQMIAQINAWLGNAGTIVFDSIRYRGRVNDAAVNAFIVAAANQFLAKGFRAIHLSHGQSLPIRLSKSLSDAKVSVKMLGDTTSSYPYAQMLLKQNEPVDFTTTFAQVVSSLRTAKSSDAIFEICLSFYRTGFHIFEELYQLKELGLLAMIIEKMNSQHANNLLQLIDPVSQRSFIYRLVEPAVKDILVKVNPEFAKPEFIENVMKMEYLILANDNLVAELMPRDRFFKSRNNLDLIMVLEDFLTPLIDASGKIHYNKINQTDLDCLYQVTQERLDAVKREAVSEYKKFGVS